jgi:hypothetical protein
VRSSVRPLDALGSIKLKLGVVILAAVAVTVLVVSVGARVGLSPLLTGVAAAALALAMVQLLAHGMTFPLREMVAAARAMARGGLKSVNVVMVVESARTAKGSQQIFSRIVFFRL